MTPALADALRVGRVARALRRAAEADSRLGAAARETAAWRDGSSLWRAAQGGGDAAPVMIVHGLVGAPEMTDLDADSSVAAALAAQGCPVYGVDWGRAGGALWRRLRVEDFALDRLSHFVDVVTAREGRRPVLAGVCEGGLFAACLAALRPDALAGLALMVTPIDIDAAPDAPLTRLVRRLGPARLTRLIDALGGLPGPMMGAVFQDLTPSRTLRRYTLGLLETDGDPAAVARFLRMERWLAARPDHPAEAAKQLLIDIYCDNALARGAFLLDGSAVRLSAIAAPVLTVIGLRDHLAPPASARAIAAHLPAPPREVALDAGHVGVFVSRRMRGRVAAALADFARACAAGAPRA